MLRSLAGIRKDAYHPQSIRLLSVETGAYEKKDKLRPEEKPFYYTDVYSYKYVYSGVMYDGVTQMSYATLIGNAERGGLVSDNDNSPKLIGLSYSESTDQNYSELQIKELQKIIDSGAMNYFFELI